MHDEFAIQAVINLSSEGASRGAFEQVGSCYTEDGIWETPVGRFEGKAAFLPAMAQTAGMFEYIVQANSPAVIKVDGDKATARSVIREHGKLAGADIGMEILGHYADTFVRTADGWKFTHRLFELQGMHNMSLLPAAV